MLLLPLFEVLVHLAFQLLAERVRLDLLFLHQFGFGLQNLFVASLHVLQPLILLHLVGLLLHLVSFLVVLLLGEVGLNLAQVEELGRKLEGQGEGLLEGGAVLLQLLSVPVLQLLNLLLVFLLGLLELHVVVLVEVLVLLDVGLLDFLLPLLVGEDNLLVLHVELLLLQLGDPVLGHLSL